MPNEIGRDELRELAQRGGQLVEVLPADEYHWPESAQDAACPYQSYMCISAPAIWTLSSRAYSAFSGAHVREALANKGSCVVDM